MTSGSSPVVLVPKNRGLAAQAERALALTRAAGERRYVRGEDVPFLAGALANAGRRVVGITGEDLLAEWIAAGNAAPQSLQTGKIAWHDPSALYGSPALCLIGPPDAAVRDAVRIAVCTKYRNLSERYISRLEARGCTVDRIAISGALETICLEGLADFIIDIVVSGATMRRAGLTVRDVILRSDIAVLRNV